jgi:hypothetical protein
VRASKVWGSGFWGAERWKDNLRKENTFGQGKVKGQKLNQTPLPYAFLLKSKNASKSFFQTNPYFSQVFHQTSCQHITIFPYLVHISTKSDGFKGGLGWPWPPPQFPKRKKNVGKK